MDIVNAADAVARSYLWAHYAVGCLTGSTPDLHWQWDEAQVAQRPLPPPSLPADTPTSLTQAGIDAIEWTVQAVRAQCEAAPGDTPLLVTMRCPLTGRDAHPVVLTFTTDLRVDVAKLTREPPPTGRWVVWPAREPDGLRVPKDVGDFWTTGIPF